MTTLRLSVSGSTYRGVTVVDCLCTAELSDCGLFRYELRRVWDSTKRVIVFVMLNPSTATASTNDRTIDKLTKFARRWGCGGFIVVNLYAYRTHNPEVLAAAGWQVGPDNDRWIASACYGRQVVCAWGNNAEKAREHEVCGIVRQVAAKTWTLALNKGGSPKHPLYVRDDTRLMEWAA